MSCSRREGLRGLWFKYCVWTFCLCWKDLATSLSNFPKRWVMAAPHSPICNCLFSPLEISINPAQALLLTHHTPLPSLYFVFLYEISSRAWYRTCSFSKSFSITQDQLGWMHMQPQPLQRWSFYVQGSIKRFPVLTQIVLNKIWSSVQATDLLTVKASCNSGPGLAWDPNHRLTIFA